MKLIFTVTHMKLQSGLAGKLLFVVFVLSLAGCATSPPAKPISEWSARTFDADYDRVWAATLDVLDQRGFVIDRMAKEDGYIATKQKENAQKRERVSVRLYREDVSTLVRVSSETEEQTLLGRGSSGNFIYYWSETGLGKSLEQYILNKVEERLEEGAGESDAAR